MGCSVSRNYLGFTLLMMEMKVQEGQIFAQGHLATELGLESELFSPRTVCLGIHFEERLA